MLTVTERDAGPNYAEVNAFLAKIPTFPWFKPAPNLDVKVVEGLVQKHLRCLEAHSGKDFSHVTLRVVRSVAEYDAACDAAYDAACDAAYNAACWVTRDAASYAARNAAYWAARDAARNAGHMVSGLPDNPWAPLCDIMALGALPIGVIDNAFVVWIP